MLSLGLSNEEPRNNLAVIAIVPIMAAELGVSVTIMAELHLLIGEELRGMNF